MAFTDRLTFTGVDDSWSDWQKIVMGPRGSVIGANVELDDAVGDEFTVEFAYGHDDDDDDTITIVLKFLQLAAPQTSGSWTHDTPTSEFIVAANAVPFSFEKNQGVVADLFTAAGAMTLANEAGIYCRVKRTADGGAPADGDLYVDPYVSHLERP